MEPKILSCGEIGIIKTAFHKKATSININEIEIDRIALFDKSSRGNKGSFKRYIGYRHKGVFNIIRFNSYLSRKLLFK